ncbi:MAG: class I SAM-dependent methyltransferase [Planctomycetes bacterium]|nr:class I SAM-dependent methyltransferase [Planctomycetota bacterium]
MAARSARIASRYAHIPVEQVDCYLCGSDASVILVRDPPFMVRRCRKCGLGYTSPRCRADCLNAVYEHGYFENDTSEAIGYFSYARDADAYVRTFRRKVPIIAAHAAGPLLLDVGCAAGSFLVAMREAGFVPHGLELAPAMVQHAREHYKLEEVHQGTLDAAPWSPSTFHVLTMFDVLEHVPDPIAVLRQAHALLRPEGVLVLQTQDLSSWLPRLLGASWHHFKQIEHIYHFNPRTLRTVLERAGFRIEVRTRQTAGKYFSIGDLLDRCHTLLHLPRWLLAPFRPFARRFIWVNPRDEMFVIARKLERA